jgi:hypothetical protein
VRISTIKFEDNAGKIWKALDERGALQKKKLLKIAKLNEKEFFTGIGWLAREDKVFKKNNDYYELDNTNLTHEIGVLAGKVWKIINIWDEVDFTTLKKLSEADDNEIYSALGWLAREDKICENEEQKYRLK